MTTDIEIESRVAKFIVPYCVRLALTMPAIMLGLYRTGGEWGYERSSGNADVRTDVYSACV